MNRIYRKMLIGVGYDGRDGHLRLTKGENFRLVGGSSKTHREMQKKVIKFNKLLMKRKKTLDDISDKEFKALAKIFEFNVKKGK